MRRGATRRELATEVPSAAAHSALDKALDSTLNAVPREAEWIALVCLHSGVFTRAQFCFYFNARPNRVFRFVRVMIEQGSVGESALPGSGHTLPGRPTQICRISNRKIYRALGCENIRHRKTASPGVLIRRLLSLDYILEHPELAWLPTERDKVRCFEALEGVPTVTAQNRTLSVVSRTP